MLRELRREARRSARRDGSMTPFEAGNGLPVALALRIWSSSWPRCSRGDGAAWRARSRSSDPRWRRVLTGLTAAHVLCSAIPVHGVLLVHQASGFALTYTVDGLSAWFLIVLSVARHSDRGLQHRLSRLSPLRWSIGLRRRRVQCAGGRGRGRLRGRRDHPFLFAWELMTLMTAALVATDHEDPRQPARRRPVPRHVAPRHRLPDRRVPGAGRGVRLAVVLDAPLGRRRVAGRCAMSCSRSSSSASASRRASIPLHVWLPEAHPAAPTNISALMSGVLIKTGIYGIVRVCVFGLGVPRLSWGVIVVAVGGLSAVLGVLYALMQHDLKRLLAYHSIENIGIILLGLGAGMMALSIRPQRSRLDGHCGRPLFHVLNHAVFKGLLFLGAGERGDDHGHTADRAVRRTASADAVDRALLPHRRDGDLRPAAAQRLRERVADVSGVPVRIPQLRPSRSVLFLFPVGGALLALTTALAAACFVKAFGISVPRLAAKPRRGRGARSARGDAGAAGVSRRAVRWAGPVSRRASSACWAG